MINKYLLSSGSILWFAVVYHGWAARLAEQFEAILNKSNLPCLTQQHFREFSVPIGNGENDFITFRGYDLAPPEGYIAVEYAKCIHRDSHWKEISWACYWNLCRRNSENLIGAESGASFFLAEYGIRIINSTNGFVGWKVSKWHGTGRY
jgi:hypothetical protein